MSWKIDLFIYSISTWSSSQLPREVTIPRSCSLCLLSHKFSWSRISPALFAGWVNPIHFSPHPPGAFKAPFSAIKVGISDFPSPYFRGQFGSQHSWRVADLTFSLFLTGEPIKPEQLWSCQVISQRYRQELFPRAYNWSYLDHTKFLTEVKRKKKTF